MDIQAFNKELAKKITIANGYEKRNEFEAAVSSWIAVTDMVLAASKSPGIESDYRNMLIKKTQQIVTHIKQLKVKLSLPRVEESQVSSINIVPEASQEPIVVEESEPEQDSDLMSDITTLPDGFLEITPTKNFKILTPHEEIDASLADEAKKAVILDNDNEGGNSHSSPSDDIVIEQPDDGSALICFACGTENSPSSKICKSCKTKLK